MLVKDADCCPFIAFTISQIQLQIKKLIPGITLRERKLLGMFKTSMKRRGICLKKMLWDFCVFRYAHIYACTCVL